VPWADDSNRTATTPLFSNVLSLKMNQSDEVTTRYLDPFRI
jgi:hypothetical protein